MKKKHSYERVPYTCPLKPVRATVQDKKIPIYFKKLLNNCTILGFVNIINLFNSRS